MSLAPATVRGTVGERSNSGGSVVATRGVAKQRIESRSRVLVARRVENECLDSTCGVVAAGSIKLHGVQTALCVGGAAGITRQNFKASRGVVISNRVLAKRTRAYGCIIGAGGVAF